MYKMSETGKMSDMKMSKSDKKKENYGAIGLGSSGTDYPWGLSINLNTAALDKLGIKDLPDAGCECMITAIGRVTNVSSSANEKKGERSVSIQVVKLAVALEDADDKAWDKVKADRKAAG